MKIIIIRNNKQKYGLTMEFVFISLQHHNIICIIISRSIIIISQPGFSFC